MSILKLIPDATPVRILPAMDPLDVSFEQNPPQDQEAARMLILMATAALGLEMPPDYGFDDDVYFAGLDSYQKMAYLLDYSTERRIPKIERLYDYLRSHPEILKDEIACEIVRLPDQEEESQVAYSGELTILTNENPDLYVFIGGENLGL